MALVLPPVERSTLRLKGKTGSTNSVDPLRGTNRSNLPFFTDIAG